MDSEKIDALRLLAGQAKDETKTPDERRAALRHIAALRGEAEYLANQVPAEQVGAVASAVAFSTVALPNGLSLRDAAEAVASGFAARGTGSQRR